jgi:oligoendopeptidase F
MIELGHAISYYFNKEEGLYKVLPASYDEAMAVVIEYIAPKIILDENIQGKLRDIQVLEYTRCTISSLFEFELWENPKNAENLYIKHYSKLGFKINNPSIWAADSFRSIDPVYIHNYVIGDILAKQLYEYLLQNFAYNYKEWGKWLIEKIYIDGRRRAFKEKLEIMGFMNPIKL